MLPFTKQSQLPIMARQLHKGEQGKNRLRRTEFQHRASWVARLSRSQALAIGAKGTPTQTPHVKQQIAPHFEQLSTTYPSVIFLKVYVDKLQEVAQQCQIRAMPTFHVYSKGQKVEEIVGGNLGALKAACEKYGSQTFQGMSHTTSGSGGASAAASTQATPVQQASTGVNDSQPTTTLQIRLADGSKLTGKFNLTQTIQDVKRFIDASSSPGGNYKLTTSYPRKELTDLSQTLQGADVADTVLTVQRG